MLFDMNWSTDIYQRIRQQETVTAEGCLCDSYDRIPEQYPGIPFPSRYLFADLSMGVWRSHQVASEFQRQLTACPALPAEPSLPPSGSGPLFAEITGRGIDEESRMDRPWKEGWDRVQRFMGEIPGGDWLFAVILPVAGSPLHQDNEIFLYLLGLSIGGTGHRLLFISRDERPPMAGRNIRVAWQTRVAGSLLPEPNSGPAGSYLFLYPGLLAECPESLLADGLIRLREGCGLLPLRRRRRPGAGDRLRFDQLAKTYRADEHVRAYAQYHGNTLFADPPFLASYAWKQFAGGGKEAAFLFLTRAWKCASDLQEKAAIQCQLQGMRIAYGNLKR